MPRVPNTESIGNRILNVAEYDRSKTKNQCTLLASIATTLILLNESIMDLVDAVRETKGTGKHETDW